MGEGGGGEYAQDKLNIHANALSPLLPQSRMHKGGELTVHKMTISNYVALESVKSFMGYVIQFCSLLWVTG